MRLNILLPALVAASTTSASELSTNAQSLFNYAMSINDPRFDTYYKYINYPDVGPFSVRFTAWYVPGLLHRNEGADLENALGALENLVATQDIDDFNSLWYGTWRESADQPLPTLNSVLYPPLIYGTYDPNWREFISTQIIQILEEFSTLIPQNLTTALVKTLEIQAIGAMRRNGSDGDNLVTTYTNPVIMRALTVGWVGEKLGNQSLIDYANEQSAEITKLFNAGNGTFGEYNAPTYYGEDIWALGAAIKYGPANQTLTLNSAYLLSTLWDDIAQHYNAFLGNMVGPYDRANSRDLTQHSAVLGQCFWGMFGYEKAPVPNKMELNLLYDAAQGAAFALIMDTVKEHIKPETITQLTTPPTDTEERMMTRIVRESLLNDTIRTHTSWLSKNLMIGGQELEETTIRNKKQFIPAIVHWASDPLHTPFPYIGFFSLYPSATTLKAVASRNRLEVSYPNTTQEGTNGFQFLLSNIPPPWNLAGEVIDGFSNLPCLSVNVTAPGLELQPTVYNTDGIYDALFYNITYAVPANFTGTPWIGLDIEYNC